MPTCCGAAEYDNSWSDNWPDFFFATRLDALAERLDCFELFEKLEKLKLKKDELFNGAKLIPSLVHGDLWSGNYVTGF